MKDFYYILATDVNCTSTEIKEAYEKLSKKLHPDLHPNDRYFENQFREISEAYETLSDPIRRRKYDEELKAIKSNSLTFAKRHPSRTKAIDITFTIILIAFTLVFGNYVIKTVKNSKAKKVYKAPALTAVSFHKTKHYKRKHSVKIKTISSSPKIDLSPIKAPAPIQAVINNHSISTDNITKADNHTNSDVSINSDNLNSKNSTTAAANILYTTYLKANESWGCGGNMTPEFYADQYRRYATYARNYPGAPLKKIASGPNSDDYNWTEVAMKKIGTSMWGLSLHYYTIPTGNWGKKGSATSFDEKQYLLTMKNCLKMEELVTKHSAIMDKYDAAKKVALVVDEWGVWTDVEPGTNPGFLYQQNSMRDALIAGTTLNIFNNHADRVKMANLAQTVNVLQSLVLTQKDKMILTPTYHVFDLYQVHQDATLLPISIQSPDLTADNVKIPAVNASASRDSSGVVHISFVNLNPTKKITVSTVLQDVDWKTVQGRIITSPKFTDYNSFDQPGKIKPAVFNGAKKQGNQLVAELPPLSVVVLTLRK